MDPSSTASITEFAIVVAGFTGLIFALAPKKGGISPVVKLRAITMLFYSFSAAFGSLAPTIMNAYGVNDIWRSSSYFLVVILIGNMAATFLSSRILLNPSQRLELKFWVWFLVMAGNSLFVILLLGSLFSIIALPITGIFMTALVWQLILSSILFTRLLL